MWVLSLPSLSFAMCVCEAGWFYFTRIIIPLEDRAPIPPLSPSRKSEREEEPRRTSRVRAYLWMDSLLTFGRVSPSRSARRPSVPSFAVGVSLDRSDVEELAVYTMFSHLKRHRKRES